jgi:hypothetical protein
MAIGAAIAGSLALVPGLLLLLGGPLGPPVVGVLSHPVVVLGGVAFALLINAAVSLSLRSRATLEEISLECHLRVRYRGPNTTVLLSAGAIGYMLVGYLLVENLGGR